MAGTQDIPIDLTADDGDVFDLTGNDHDHNHNNNQVDFEGISALISMYLTDDKLGRPIFYQQIPPEWLEEYIQMFLDRDRAILSSLCIMAHGRMAHSNSGFVQCLQNCERYLKCNQKTLQGVDAVVMWRFEWWTQIGFGYLARPHREDMEARLRFWERQLRGKGDWKDREQGGAIMAIQGME